MTLLLTGAGAKRMSPDTRVAESSQCYCWCPWRGKEGEGHV